MSNGRPLKWPKLIWLIVDGLSSELVAKLTSNRQERFPYLAAQSSRLVPQEPNCQTPPSLFSLFSGKAPLDHRMFGYEVPTPTLGPLGTRFAFDDWPRNHQLIWEKYAEDGMSSRLCAVPFLAPGHDNAVLTASLVFNRPTFPQEIFLREQQISEYCLQNLGSGGPNGFIQSASELLQHGATGTFVCIPSDELRKAPNPTGLCSGPAVRLRKVAIDGRPGLYFSGSAPIRLLGKDAPNFETEWLNGRTYACSNPGRLFQSGLLGVHADAGGAGEAEANLTTLMRDMHEDFCSDYAWALKRGGQSLTILYYPIIDLVCHQILRQSLRSGTPYEHSMLRVMDWVEAIIKTLTAHARRNSSMLLVNSDHGMAPVHTDIRLNEWLYKQGLLRLDANGCIDPQSSKVFLHPAENGCLTIRRDELLSQPNLVFELLDKFAVSEVVRERREISRLSVVRFDGNVSTCEWDFNTYLGAPPGTRLRAELGGPILAPSKKGGDHTTPNGDPWLDGIVYAFNSSNQLPDKLQASDLLDFIKHSSTCSS